MNKLLDYLHLREVGGLEMLMAVFPILIGYTLFGLPMGIVLCAVVTFFLFFIGIGKRKRIKSPIVYFVAFMLLHDIFLLFVIQNSQGVFFNSLIGQLAYLVAALYVGYNLDFAKFRGCVNWVSILCIGGMLYHFSLVLRGMQFSPILLPFMPEQELSSRFFLEYDRPTSFFMEAQSYVSFMMIPLFFAIEERKYIWAVIISITIFMSSSTTGLVLVFLMFGLMAFMGGGANKVGRTIFLFALGVGLLFFLLRSGLFEQGIGKATNESANWSEEIRIVQGPLLISSMDLSEWLLGIPYANAYQYSVAKGLTSSLIVYGENSMFVPAFWLALLRYGIIGLFLFLNIYLYYYKLNKSLRPYIITLFLTLFTNPDFLGGVFCYELYFIIAYYRYNTLGNESYPYRIRLRKSNA